MGKSAAYCTSKKIRAKSINQFKVLLDEHTKSCHMVSSTVEAFRGIKLPLQLLQLLVDWSDFVVTVYGNLAFEAFGVLSLMPKTSLTLLTNSPSGGWVAVYFLPTIRRRKDLYLSLIIYSMQIYFVFFQYISYTILLFTWIYN